jgi:hypothetical protein
MNLIRLLNAVDAAAAPQRSATEAGASAFSMLSLSLSGRAHDIVVREAEQFRSRFPKSAEHRLDVDEDGENEED